MKRKIECSGFVVESLVGFPERSGVFSSYVPLLFVLEERGCCPISIFEYCIPVALQLGKFSRSLGVDNSANGVGDPALAPKICRLTLECVHNERPHGLTVEVTLGDGVVVHPCASSPPPSPRFSLNTVQ